MTLQIVIGLPGPSNQNDILLIYACTTAEIMDGSSLELHGTLFCLIFKGAFIGCFLNLEYLHPVLLGINEYICIFYLVFLRRKDVDPFYIILMLQISNNFISFLSNFLLLLKIHHRNKQIIPLLKQSLIKNKHFLSFLFLNLTQPMKSMIHHFINPFSNLLDRQFEWCLC